MMENETILWLVGIILLAAVVVYALRKGYNVTLKRKHMEARFQKNDKGPSGTDIEVGKGMTVKGSKTGDISGIKMTGSGRPANGISDPSISVLDKAKIEDAEIKDISGVKHGEEDAHSKS